MLFYNIITNKEGLDESEGNDCVRDSKLISNQCITCRKYYYNSKNFNNKKYICDGCYHCVVYENENPNLTFRIVILKSGTFRTVSNYFFTEIEKILENLTLTKDFGWIYKDGFIRKNQNLNLNNLRWIFMWNRTTVPHK